MRKLGPMTMWLSSSVAFATFLGGCATFLGACAGDTAPVDEVFTLTLRADSRDGPVADARFWSDGHELGSSDAQGLLRAELHGARAQSVMLASACPPQYRTQNAERRLVLQPLRSEREGGDAALTLTTQCEPLERQAAIVVRTRGAAHGGIPIQIGGQVVGQTDASGTAHLLVRTKPHASLRVVLDTSAQPELVPRNPVHTLQLEEQDEVFVVDAVFEAAVDEPRRRAPVLSWARSTAHLPQRIPSADR